MRLKLNVLLLCFRKLERASKSYSFLKKKYNTHENTNTVFKYLYISENGHFLFDISHAFINSIYEYSIFRDLERWEFIVFGF